jgi:DNA-binding transcriptional LysR family regulator
VVIPLRDPPIARTMVLIWDRRRDLPPAAELFVDHLRGEVTDTFENS